MWFGVFQAFLDLLSQIVINIFFLLRRKNDTADFESNHSALASSLGVYFTFSDEFRNEGARNCEGDLLVYWVFYLMVFDETKRNFWTHTLGIWNQQSFLNFRMENFVECGYPFRRNLIFKMDFCWISNGFGRPTALEQLVGSTCFLFFDNYVF